MVCISYCARGSATPRFDLSGAVWTVGLCSQKQQLQLVQMKHHSYLLSHLGKLLDELGFDHFYSEADTYIEELGLKLSELHMSRLWHGMQYDVKLEGLLQNTKFRLPTTIFTCLAAFSF